MPTNYVMIRAHTAYYLLLATPRNADTDLPRLRLPTTTYYHLCWRVTATTKGTATTTTTTTTTCKYVLRLLWYYYLATHYDLRLRLTRTTAINTTYDDLLKTIYYHQLRLRTTSVIRLTYLLTTTLYYYLLHMSTTYRHTYLPTDLRRRAHTHFDILGPTTNVNTYCY